MERSPQSLSDVPPRQGFLLGLALIALGTFIELLSFDVIGSDSNTPPLIGGLAGGLFLMPGILSVYYAIRNDRRLKSGRQATPGFDVAGWLVGSITVTALAFIGGWVSLQGHSENFSGGVTGSLSEVRIAFGIGSVICAACAAVYWSYGFIQLRRDRNRARTNTEEES